MSELTTAQRAQIIRMFVDYWKLPIESVYLITKLARWTDSKKELLHKLDGIRRYITPVQIELLEAVKAGRTLKWISFNKQRQYSITKFDDDYIMRVQSYKEDYTEQLSIDEVFYEIAINQNVEVVE